MDRAQFMRELENLLADIPETERREALEFYENYFDDAGPENETSVLQELGSPEKVAAIIKADLKGSAEQYEYGEYTEHGYEDPRTKEPGQMPEKYGTDRKGNSFFKKGNQAVLILAVIALVFISPFIKGMLGLALKIVLTIVLLPFVLVAVLGLGSAGLLISGIGSIAVGIGFCASVPAVGIMAMGIGCLLIALGLLMILGTMKTATALVPKWFRKITDFGNKLLYRKKGDA